MRAFKTRRFGRFANDKGLRDDALREAILRAELGLVDADLGGGVVKLRIGREGQGRSRGFRAHVLYRKGERAFFAQGLAKSQRENLRQDELRGLKRLADEMLKMSDADLEVALTKGAIVEVEMQ